MSSNTSPLANVVIPAPGVCAWNVAAVLGLLLLSMAVTTWDTRFDPAERLDISQLAWVSP